MTTDKFYIISRMGRIGATGASEQDPSETRAFGCQDLERDRLGRAVGSSMFFGDRRHFSTGHDASVGAPRNGL